LEKRGEPSAATGRRKREEKHSSGKHKEKRGDRIAPVKGVTTKSRADAVSTKEKRNQPHRTHTKRKKEGESLDSASEKSHGGHTARHKKGKACAIKKKRSSFAKLGKKEGKKKISSITINHLKERKKKALSPRKKGKKYI